ncbi:MAG: tetratricopeptide repeat protein [Alphaproteobacteria bacterium]
MRLRVALAAFIRIALAPLLLAAPVALAQDVPVSVGQRLDDAFQTLQTTPDQGAAKRAERRIIRLWLESGSDTVDLLMSWALRAIDDDDFPLALDYLDRIILLRPEYAEGWNKRATVFFLLDDYAKAIADIEHVLILEPRHFGALSGLGMIMRDLGEADRAIEIFEMALSIDPLLDNVREALQALFDETAGTDI